MEILLVPETGRLTYTVYKSRIPATILPFRLGNNTLIILIMELQKELIKCEIRYLA